MPRKIAIKKLTASDLTFFEWHFRNHNAGNQKAINLSADVFVEQLYPALPEMTVELGGRVAVDLSVFGPGSKGMHNLQRKIVKFGSYKNWRLNGEFIYNPSEDLDRYNPLVPGDFAIMEFSGAAVPNAVKLILVATAVGADVRLHSSIDKFMRGRSMAAVPLADLGRVIGEGSLTDDHPALMMTIDSDLEDAALGGNEGRRRLFAHSTNRHVTKDDLARARTNADETGRIGEELVNSFLIEAVAAGDVTSVEWTAQSNAVAPYDFKLVIPPNDLTILIDVKTTTGEFERPIHFSFNEILQIANGAERFDVYRVYDASPSGGKLRISSELRLLGQQVLKAISALPEGVTADGVSVLPARLGFSNEADLRTREHEPQA